MQDIKRLENRITELEQENKNLHETIAYLTKKIYGRSSETSNALGIEGQMSLFDEAETQADAEVTEPSIEEAEKVWRKKYAGQRKEKLDKLSHDKIVFKLEDEDLACPQCRNELTRVGEEVVRTEVEYIPAKLRVIDYYRETYECRKCKNTAHPYMEKTPPILLCGYMHLMPALRSRFGSFATIQPETGIMHESS